MGSIQNEIFDLQFIQRTRNIIEQYEGEYNITLLLNCLLGLIVLPSEFYNRKKCVFFNQELSSIQELKPLIQDITTFSPTKRSKRTTVVDDEKSLKNFIKKIRNGVSHQQIECIDDNGKWIKVTIRDFNKFNNNALELEVSWTPKQLKYFALFVADKYLEEIAKLTEKKEVVI